MNFYGESKMTQNLSILTGCSAGATVRDLEITFFNGFLKLNWSSRKVLSSYHSNLSKSSQLFILSIETFELTGR